MSSKVLNLADQMGFGFPSVSTLTNNVFDSTGPVIYNSTWASTAAEINPLQAPAAIPYADPSPKCA